MALLDTARCKRYSGIVYLSCAIKSICVNDDNRNMYNIWSHAFVLLRINYLLNY